MINPNKFANQKIQELGKSLFQGEEMAQQMANKQLDQPVPPPGPYGDMNPIMNKESREARRQERKNIRMANKGLRQARRERAKGVKEQGQENYSYDGYEKGRYNKKGDDIEYGKVKRYSKKNPPSGSDASFGISGYVNDKKEFKSALNQNDPLPEPKMPERSRKIQETPVEQPRQKTYRESSGKRIYRSNKQKQLRPHVEEPSRIERIQQIQNPLNQNDPNKDRPYVVNKEKTGTSKDTLFLPKGAYVSKGGYMDDVQYEQEAKKAAAKGIYNYTKSLNFENLEGSGKVKYKN